MKTKFKSFQDFCQTKDWYDNCLENYTAYKYKDGHGPFASRLFQHKTKENDFILELQTYEYDEEEDLFYEDWKHRLLQLLAWETGSNLSSINEVRVDTFTSLYHLH